MCFKRLVLNVCSLSVALMGSNKPDEHKKWIVKTLEWGNAK